ncbi:MAG TPA: hypothetical protein VHY91_02050 [Pirellulales bacterium]|nr:hypothetical protein [Pirellulales bacterium]
MTVIVLVGSLVAGSNHAGSQYSYGPSFDGTQTVVSLQSQHVRIQT